jgi:hypothetical protein
MILIVGAFIISRINYMYFEKRKTKAGHGEAMEESTFKSAKGYAYSLDLGNSIVLIAVIEKGEKVSELKNPLYDLEKVIVRIV